jgi:hypothetical protein
VLLHRYTVLVTSGRVSSYVADGLSLLTVLFRDVIHRKDLRTIMHLSTKTLSEKLGPVTANVGHTLLPLSEWWTLFLTTCKGLLKMGETYQKQLLHLVLCAATLNMFCTPELELKYVMFASSVCCKLREFDIAFNLIKPVSTKVRI